MQHFRATPPDLPAHVILVLEASLLFKVLVCLELVIVLFLFHLFIFIIGQGWIVFEEAHGCRDHVSQVGLQICRTCLQEILNCNKSSFSNLFNLSVTLAIRFCLLFSLLV